MIGQARWFSLRSLRTSAFSALNFNLNAEVRRDRRKNLIDAGSEAVHCIDYEYGNRRVENQIENHA